MSYDQDNVFAKILRKEIPADVVHEDDRCIAFVDINPQAPTHILIVPVKPIPRVGESEEAGALLDELRDRFPDDPMVQSVRIGQP